ncbi:MAG: hypothetical protein IJS76_03425 [Pseudobutyrivibrio sp.]|nr:hypothetical protein [Pseudobutyrivibrio sp.]
MKKFIFGLLLCFCLLVGCGAKETDSLSVDTNIEKNDEFEFPEKLANRLSGTWSNDDEKISMEIKLNGKNYWSMYYTTEVNGTQIFPIDNIIDTSEKEVLAKFKDCDYLVKMSDGGDFAAYAGIKIQDENAITIKWSKSEEYLLNRE